VFFSLAWFTPLDPHEQLVLTAYRQLVLGIVDRPDHAGSQQQRGGGGIFSMNKNTYINPCMSILYQALKMILLFGLYDNEAVLALTGYFLVTNGTPSLVNY
jgi:hypothetical protein